MRFTAYSNPIKQLCTTQIPNQSLSHHEPWRVAAANGCCTLHLATSIIPPCAVRPRGTFRIDPSTWRSDLRYARLLPYLPADALHVPSRYIWNDPWASLLNNLESSSARNRRVEATFAFTLELRGNGMCTSSTTVRGAHASIFGLL